MYTWSDIVSVSHCSFVCFFQIKFQFRKVLGPSVLVVSFVECTIWILSLCSISVFRVDYFLSVFYLIARRKSIMVMFLRCPVQTSAGCSSHPSLHNPLGSSAASA